jgi:hypothetical protein
MISMPSRGHLARRANHPLGAIPYLDRLAHVEDEDLAARPHRSGLQSQLTSLGAGHEEPFDIGMRGGHAPAALDLLAEQVGATRPSGPSTLPKRTVTKRASEPLFTL